MVASALSSSICGLRLSQWPRTGLLSLAKAAMIGTVARLHAGWGTTDLNIHTHGRNQARLPVTKAISGVKVLPNATLVYT